MASASRAGASRSRPPPSSRPDQLDSDDLPPYELLDPILEQIIEGQRGAVGDRAAAGRRRRDSLKRVSARVDRNEYKRRQAPLVLRTSRKAFGPGRRLPIAQRYRGDQAA